MKKYLALAAVLGAIAVISASFIAQAAPETTAVTTTIEKTSETTTLIAPAPAADVLAQDTADCTALAAAPKNDGTAPSESEKADIVSKCLAEKGHAAAATADVDAAADAEAGAEAGEAHEANDPHAHH